VRVRAHRRRVMWPSICLVRSGGRENKEKGRRKGKEKREGEKGRRKEKEKRENWERIKRRRGKGSSK
jgi:hypothetical protein